ncbi:MAG TPA: BON domain-containing protein [Methanomicrobiales archaeon]|nr:BON domain-containing protein [Methanomicrobiales archaeon]
MALSDEEVGRRVADRLAWDDRIDASDVHVEARNGHVTLKGTVQTIGARKAAEMDTHGVPDVTYVENRLTVRYAAPGQKEFSDDQIKRTVEDHLSANYDLYAQEIHVSVNNGQVFLQGAVDAYWRRKVAEEVASLVRGVVDVVNNLNVTPAEILSDEKILADVTAALERSPGVNRSDVSVDVRHRIVTLWGRVPDLRAYDAAITAAENTRGVVRVKSNLSIRGTSGSGTAGG